MILPLICAWLYYYPGRLSRFQRRTDLDDAQYVQNNQDDGKNE